VSTPDRMAYLAACEREAAAPAYRPPAREDSRTHQDAIMAAHASTTVAGAAPASGEGHGPWPRPVI
jgi:spore germination protein YaaH